MRGWQQKLRNFNEKAKTTGQKEGNTAITN